MFVRLETEVARGARMIVEQRIRQGRRLVRPSEAPSAPTVAGRHSRARNAQRTRAAHRTRNAQRTRAARRTRNAPRMGLVLALVCCFVLSACSGSGTGDGGLSVTFRFDPPAPAVGTARLELRLVDPAGQPVQGAAVAVEANMDHAGMAPTFATLTEDGAGRYVGDVEFTMGGDWFLVLDVTLADGRKVARTLDVPGVRSDG